MENIGEMVPCKGPGCQVRFRKKTRWHDYHERKCQQAAWALKRAEEIKAQVKP